jgi:DNA helicase IV
MTQQHPDLVAEQAHIDYAYECLELSKTDAWKLRGLTEAGIGVGGTFQARYERDVFDEALVNRLSQLDLGSAALVFGRIDRQAEGPDALESFHIGRLAIADQNRDPVVIDWRAPVAEPFYRATGRDSMGLVRRRHFAVTGRQLLGIEDELFGEGHLGLGHDEGLEGGTPGVTQAGTGLRGYSTLLAALQRGRTGQLGDIVATIQGEQDEIIRSNSAGVLVVQGGPGTGKTVVALHRAAYLLYTYRFPLEDQGEAGVEQLVLSDLVQDVDFGGRDEPFTARVKGTPKMAAVIAKAIRDRERALREDLVIPYGSFFLRLRAEESARIVKGARRRYRRHNAGRRWVENEVWAALADSSREELSPDVVRENVRALDDVRAALERMWPVLSPAELLHDLFGSKALLKLAAAEILPEAEYLSLYRERSADVRTVKWTDNDSALLDEARELLGPRMGKNGKADETEEIRTFGHIVIDEVQDLTPMQLRMASRRSLNGSMTVVGDLAQATGPLAPATWDDVLAHLPISKKEPRTVGLSIGYRIPGLMMELATKVMMAATPELRAPTSVREGGDPPAFVRAASTSQLGELAVEAVRELIADVGDGNVAIVCPDAMSEEMAVALDAAGIDHGRATRHGIEGSVTIVPVSVVKGLELDGVVVVEPGGIIAQPGQGLRGLYVALTRSTKRLSIIYTGALPEVLR